MMILYIHYVCFMVVKLTLKMLTIGKLCAEMCKDLLTLTDRAYHAFLGV